MNVQTTSDRMLSLTEKELHALVVALQEAVLQAERELARTDLHGAHEVVRQHEQSLRSLLEKAKKLESGQGTS